MVELVVSAVLLTTLLSMLAPMLKWIKATESLNSGRQAASDHLNNVMERVAALKKEQRTRETIETLCKLGIDDLPLSNVEAVVALENQPRTDTNPAALRIHISLIWHVDGVKISSPQTLTAWFH
jgi:hypothetical protein